MGDPCHDQFSATGARLRTQADGLELRPEAAHRMTVSDHATTIGSIALPAVPSPLRARHGASTPLWFLLSLLVAALMLAALGGGGHRAAGPPRVTVGTAAYHGDAA